MSFLFPELVLMGRIVVEEERAMSVSVSAKMTSLTMTRWMRGCLDQGYVSLSVTLCTAL